MEVTVALEQRFDRTPDGAVWTPNAFACNFHERYLQVFDSVQVLARVRDVSGVPKSFLRADGPHVRFCALPSYIGPWQYARALPALRRAVRAFAGGQSAAILRLPGPVGGLLWRILRREGRPYGVEIVGDPYDVFAPGVVDHPLRLFLRRVCTWQLRRQCARAACAAYVTREALQRRYPCPGYSVPCSDAELPPVRPARRPGQFSARPFRLVAVGSLEQLYKGPDVLMRALALCARHGQELSLTWAGDGQYRCRIEELACRLNLSQHVRFTGALPPLRVIEELDAAHLFVMPSRTEGLPKAMLEAMARGLPCIGSRVGGIPELIGREELFAPDDASALAGKLMELSRAPERLAEMSRRNLETVRDYQPGVLRERRRIFYRHLRHTTENWLRHSCAKPQ